LPALPPDEPSRREEVALKKLATLFLLIALSSISRPQQMSHRLNNKDIIEMVALGLSDDVIIAKIRSAAKPEDLDFDTSTEGLKQLKAGNVSDAVMRVMINPASSSPIAVPVPGIEVWSKELRSSRASTTHSASPPVRKQWWPPLRKV
jgi:hypothetical protein